LKTIIVLPTYNEAENLPRLIPQIMEMPIDGLEIMMVDDNSPDGTGDIAEELAGKYPGRICVLHREGKGGLGSAYCFGFHKAVEMGADAIGQMDSDFSHPPQKLADMIPLIKDYDFIIGSRYVPGGSVDVNWPIWRKGLSAWGNLYARTILGLPIKDVTGGFRIWKSEVIQNIPWEKVQSSG